MRIEPSDQKNLGRAGLVSCGIDSSIPNSWTAKRASEVRVGCDETLSLTRLGATCRCRRRRCLAGHRLRSRPRFRCPGASGSGMARREGRARTGLRQRGVATQESETACIDHRRAAARKLWPNSHGRCAGIHSTPSSRCSEARLTCPVTGGRSSEKAPRHAGTEAMPRDETPSRSGDHAATGDQAPAAAIRQRLALQTRAWCSAAGSRSAPRR